MNLLFLCTDAFGGQGGIAKFNRDLCRALSADPLSADVTALPRVSPVESVNGVPHRVDYRPEVSGHRLNYVWNVLRDAVRAQQASWDGVICGHINLLPVAAFAARIRNVPLLLILHGIDAWTRHSSIVVRRSLSSVDRFVTVSEYTMDRFLEWSPLTREQGTVIPNCIDLESYGPGSKREDLLQRYDLNDRTILLTLGRLSAGEQYKGHDEILEILPDLAREVNDIAYLICGDGDDRPRLEAKAQRLGVDDRVVFAGYVREEEKADHYRLADAYVMPGRGEGFGIVYLEALACGVPVVASSADASEEAVRGGMLGQVVDPEDRASVAEGILEALDTSHDVPAGLEYFSVEKFNDRWHDAAVSSFGSEKKSPVTAAL